MKSKQTQRQVTSGFRTDKERQDYIDAFIETYKKTSILHQIRERRRERKKQEFLGRLKYGKRYHKTDDPGPF